MTVTTFRLVLRDAHQLFQRLESQAQEYVLEVKVRLLKQMSTGLKTPQQARQFVSMLLDEYVCLCTAAKKQASYLNELVSIGVWSSTRVHTHICVHTQRDTESNAHFNVIPSKSFILICSECY